MNEQSCYTVSGKENGIRIESRILEEKLQEAVAQGHRRIKVEALGQHGIGGRLWKAGNEPVSIVIEGHSGQRTGSLGFPNTTIELMGPASDDIGWLNAGADIIVHGNAANGACNGMAQGKVYVDGNIGSRGMTMTKRNPRFDPPELWVRGTVGDYFGEFMAGGIAVICGHDGQSPDNVLGYRPLVGMVGGSVFFRGPHQGYSEADARLTPLSDDDWQWLTSHLKTFLEAIGKQQLYAAMSIRDDWQLLSARSPLEKVTRQRRSMTSFHSDVWEKELGRGGIVGDLTDVDMRPIPLIVTGELRRFVPVWENRSFMAPCEAACPTGIPVQQRWQLVREGRFEEAVDLALAYTPFPATVCGYLCPNLCMTACTRRSEAMKAVDIQQLGKASLSAGTPTLPPLSGRKIAVIGGGPAGISVAWQLRQQGHEATVYDTSKTLGGKMTAAIPESRIPREVLHKELERVREIIPHVHLQQPMSRGEMEQLEADYDFIVIATGAHQPRTLPVPGKERMITALEFLKQAKAGKGNPGERVVIIGAGNVGCDVATEAHRYGAREITLIDVQKPAAFGKEREEAEACGATFRWPCFTKEITEEGVMLTSGEILPADTVVVSIGDMPDTDFLPRNVKISERGYVEVDEHFRTSDPKIFAIGDMVRPGLLTDAIGAGRSAAAAIGDLLSGQSPLLDERETIDTHRVSLEYFDPRVIDFEGVEQCGSQCASCGNCRDCGICMAICPRAAISRNQLSETEFEYVVDPDKCIGCGFCAGACPCGVWDLKENTPLSE
jgi:NADPH-dependent glutamate synthase beta subunit-like oxidoreductase/glutamate synthase domain-containing protein 3/ferredoxin